MSTHEPSLLEKLRAAVAGSPPLRLAVLFGSQATGKAHAGGDVDVGILPIDERMPIGDELAFASALSAVTGTEVISCARDLLLQDAIAMSILVAEKIRQGAGNSRRRARRNDATSA